MSSQTPSSIEAVIRNERENVISLFLRLNNLEREFFDQVKWMAWDNVPGIRHFDLRPALAKFWTGSHYFVFHVRKTGLLFYDGAILAGEHFLGVGRDVDDAARKAIVSMLETAHLRSQTRDGFR